ncbi:MAG TPA: ribonuclease Z [Myxococcota bacterium]|nr:ribonuclease Z [Myxococcota bacterium]
MRLRLTILGSGTTLPDPERGAAGFLLQAGGAALLVDGGTGTIARLARAGVDARELDGGIYTHRHVDHTGDLVPLVFTMKVGIDRPRQRNYPIWAGEGFAAFLQDLQGVYGGWLDGEGWTTPVTELPLDGAGSAELPGGLRLETLPANHSAGALHLRFSAGDKRVVLSGDTATSDNLVELARGADLLICECAVPEPDDYGGHLCPADIRDLLERARPKRTLLTHLYPHVDPKAALAEIERSGLAVERAYDGQCVEI